MIRVLLIGDVRLNREGLASLIRGDGRIEVAADAAPSDETDLTDGSADVVVVDTSSHEGIEAIRRVVDGKAPMVALGAPSDDAQLIALAEMGVLGFVERDASLDELVAGIASAVRREASLPPRIGTALLRCVSSHGEHRGDSADISALTMRERQVVRLVAEGLTNKEIAARLCIELATAKNHVHNILEKLQVSGRSEAVARLGFSDGEAGRPAGALLAAAGSTPEA